MMTTINVLLLAAISCCWTLAAPIFPEDHKPLAIDSNHTLETPPKIKDTSRPSGVNDDDDGHRSELNRGAESNRRILVAPLGGSPVPPHIGDGPSEPDLETVAGTIAPSVNSLSGSVAGPTENRPKSASSPSNPLDHRSSGSYRHDFVSDNRSLESNAGVESEFKRAGDFLPGSQLPPPPPPPPVYDRALKQSYFPTRPELELRGLLGIHDPSSPSLLIHPPPPPLPLPNYDQLRVNDSVTRIDFLLSYDVDDRPIERFGSQEKTQDGLIEGEFGFHHSNGVIRGVRYTADPNIHPRLLYETLMKFLAL